jgi:hypothetical protein
MTACTPTAWIDPAQNAFSRLLWLISLMESSSHMQEGKVNRYSSKVNLCSSGLQGAIVSAYAEGMLM